MRDVCIKKYMPHERCVLLVIQESDFKLDKSDFMPHEGLFDNQEKLICGYNISNSV